MSNFYKTDWFKRYGEVRPWLDNYLDLKRNDCSFSGNGLSTSFPPIFPPTILVIEETESNVVITFGLNTYTGIECLGTTIEYSDNLLSWTVVGKECDSPQTLSFVSEPDGTYYFRMSFTDGDGQVSDYSPIYQFEITQCYLLTQNFKVLNTQRDNQFINQNC